MLTTLRIIVAALALGLAGFLAFAYWWHEISGPRDVPEFASFLSWVAVALALTQPIVFTFTRMALAREALQKYRKDDIGPFRKGYMAAVIVGAAGIEGGGLLAAVAYFLEGRVVALGAAALCVVILLLSFPSRRSLDNLIAQRP